MRAQLNWITWTKAAHRDRRRFSLLCIMCRGFALQCFHFSVHGCHKGDLLDTMILFRVIIILQEDESPGVETLERIERTSTLIGANHKLRLAEVELQPYQYKGDNMGV